MKLDHTNLSNVENFFKTKSSEITYAFAEIAAIGFKKSFSFEIDCNKLNSDYASKINITKEGDFVSIFKTLQDYQDLPAIYIFGINSEVDYDVIIKEIENANNDNTLKFPANNKNNQNNGVLYVGKVKSCAWGRLIQHLGYHQNKKSHGLQIDYWAKRVNMPLNLTYTVMFFDKKMSDYLETLEIAIAKELAPIIGKH